jgi:hypothetical protein
VGSDLIRQRQTLGLEVSSFDLSLLFLANSHLAASHTFDHSQFQSV